MTTAITQLSNLISFTALQINRKKYQILSWTFIWILTACFLGSFYPTIKSQSEDLKQILDNMPPGILGALNITDKYGSTPESFISGQFLTLFLLIGSAYAWFQGIGIIGGKIEDKVMHQWLLGSFSRISVYLGQFFSTSLVLIISSAATWVTFFAIMMIQNNDVSLDYLVSAFLGTVLVFASCLAIGQLAGTLFQRSLSQNLGAGIIVIMYFINGFADLDVYPEWFKYISIFHYLNVPLLRDEMRLETGNILVLLTIILAGIIIGSVFFSQKDIQA